MKFYLTILIVLFSLVSSADINKLSKLNGTSNIVTKVEYTDGLEVSTNCVVRFLMGGHKQVGPYVLNGTNLIDDEYVKTVIESGNAGLVTNIHIYGQRRVNINLYIDDKLRTYNAMWIHQPSTNDIYSTVYDWHMTVSQTNCFNSAGSRTFSVNYAKEYNDVLIQCHDPFSNNDDGGYIYYCSFGEIQRRRFFIGSCGL